ncbi:MAG: HAMP domain-containing sensor histidine kinase [Anaerolineae bacterium]
MNRLWVRLTLAFALVIVVTAGVVALMADLTAGRALRYYLSYSDMLPHQALVDRLAAYYALFGTWDGVDPLLDQAGTVPGPMMGTGRWPGREPPPGSPLHFVLAAADGRVVYDGLQGQPGRRLSRDEQAVAQEILVDEEVVGHLVVTVPISSTVMGPLEESFVQRLRRWLLIGALLAGGLGLLLVLAVSRSMTAPLQRLAEAARVVAGRDFRHRVEVDGSAEIAEVARAFNDMTSALQESEQQRQNMVADLAHELRSPLSVLQGNLRAILDDVYPLDKAEVARLYDETRLLSRLVDDLRELALADAGQLRLSLAATDAARVVGDTVDSLGPVAEHKAVELEVRLPGDLPRVQADSDRLAQVLRNLLVNALRHTPAGGQIAVSAAAVDGRVEFAVSDTGEGIRPEDLPHVFDRFWRADPARTRRPENGDPDSSGQPSAPDGRWSGGTGLGLSIAQSLVEAQGGEIWAESTPGQGSIFRFCLPLASHD